MAGGAAGACVGVEVARSEGAENSGANVGVAPATVEVASTVSDATGPGSLVGETGGEASVGLPVGIVASVSAQAANSNAIAITERAIRIRLTWTVIWST